MERRQTRETAAQRAASEGRPLRYLWLRARGAILSSVLLALAFVFSLMTLIAALVEEGSSAGPPAEGGPFVSIVALYLTPACITLALASQILMIAGAAYRYRMDRLRIEDARTEGLP